ncbi:type VI secretion system protein TssL, short form [Proteus mirabilis]|uniref:type VI secretion system protein TssL, short form n=1 Tax=Proteus mirabilis TaxID=584 RepID=UPI0034D49BB7
MITNIKTDKNNTIDVIFADTWLMVCQLRQGAEIHDGKTFYKQVCELIDKTRQQLTEHGYSQQAIENMLYGQCALIDESVMNRSSRDDGYMQWLQSPLQAKYFNTLEAGDKLWDRLKNILNEHSPNQDVLVCFHRIITLGFVGKYRQTDAPEREQIIALLNNQLPAYALSSQLPLVIKPKHRINRRHLYWLTWVGGFVVIAALWWGFSASLDNLLQQWVTQG